MRKHLPEEHVPDGYPEHKPIPTRNVLETVLWILKTVRNGACCRKAYPNYKLCIGASRLGAATRFLRRVWMDTNELRDRGVPDGATFVIAKGSWSEVETTNAERAWKSWRLSIAADYRSIPPEQSLSALQLLNGIRSERQFNELLANVQCFTAQRELIDTRGGSFANYEGKVAFVGADDFRRWLHDQAQLP
jgi:hypothetical protein